MRLTPLSRRGAYEVKGMEKPPKEIWLLRNKETGDWVIAFDDPPGAENFLACFTRKDAKAAADHQLNTYEVDCEPVRVVPTLTQPLKAGKAADEIRDLVLILKGLGITTPGVSRRKQIDKTCDAILDLLPGHRAPGPKAKVVKFRSPRAT